MIDIWTIGGLILGFGLGYLIQYIGQKMTEKHEAKQRQRLKEYAASQIINLRKMQNLYWESGLDEMALNVQDLIEKIEANPKYAATNNFLYALLLLKQHLKYELAQQGLNQ